MFVNQEGILREIREVFSKRYDLESGLVLSEAILAQNEIEQKTYAAPLKKPSTRREKFIPTLNYKKRKDTPKIKTNSGKTSDQTRYCSQYSQKDLRWQYIL